MGKGIFALVRFLSFVKMRMCAPEIFLLNCPDTGYFGVVRMATHRVTGTAVAVKSVPKRKQAYVDMLRQEINVLRVS